MTKNGREIQESEELRKVMNAEIDRIIQETPDYKERCEKLSKCRRKRYLGAEE